MTARRLSRTIGSVTHDNYRDAQRLGQAPIDYRAALWPSRIPRDYVGLITMRTGQQVFWTGRMAIGLHFNAPVLKFTTKLKSPLFPSAPKPQAKPRSRIAA